jgi:hypothetical protein
MLSCSDRIEHAHPSHARRGWSVGPREQTGPQAYERLAKHRLLGRDVLIVENLRNPVSSRTSPFAPTREHTLVPHLNSA